MILPAAFRARVLRIDDDANVQTSSTWGGQMQIGREMNPETRIRVTSPKISREVAGICRAFLKQHRKNVAFDVIPAFFSRALGVINTPLQVRTAAAAGSTVVELKNGPANTQYIVKCDDMLNFASHDKAYWIGINQSGVQVTPFNTDASGNVTIRLSDPLRKAVNVDEVVNFTTPRITVVRTSDVSTQVSVDDAKMFVMQFEAVELT